MRRKKDPGWQREGFDSPRHRRAVRRPCGSASVVPPTECRLIDQNTALVIVHMSESLSLAVDPTSPEASLEDRFFQQGFRQETDPMDELPPAHDPNRRARHLRWAAQAGIAAMGLLAVALLIWGGPSEEETPSAALSASTQTASAPPARPGPR